jgi:hypothetical protein
MFDFFLALRVTSKWPLMRRPIFPLTRSLNGPSSSSSKGFKAQFYSDISFSLFAFFLGRIVVDGVQTELPVLGQLDK